MAEKKLTVAEVAAQIEARTQEILAKRLQTVEADVNRVLDQRIMDVIAQAIGFSNHWGRWEVDHCNGRATEVANQIGKLATERIGTEFTGWLSKMMASAERSKELRKAVTAEFRSQLQYRMRASAGRLADAEAAKRIAVLLGESAGASEPGNAA